MTKSARRHATVTAHEAGAEPHTEEFETPADAPELIARRAVERLQAPGEHGETPEMPSLIEAAHLGPDTIAAKITWYRGADWFLVIELEDIAPAH